MKWNRKNMIFILAFVFLFVFQISVKAEGTILPQKISLNKTSLVLTKNQTYHLQETIMPSDVSDNYVKWKSSNSKVVSVTSDGKIKALKSGTVKISVETVNGKKAICTVKVITPSKLTLNKTKLMLVPGQAYTLKSTIAPSSAENAEVTWTSSNKKVATVTSKGRVKIVGFGTATITAKTANNVKATCRITSKSYAVSGKKLKVKTSDGVKTYTLYRQKDYSSYYTSFGCVTTAVSIVSSAYGKTYSPVNIHTGNSSAFYSERYALKKMKASSSLYGSAISVKLASQILKDMGIKNKAVCSYNKTNAITQIKAHVKAGKPVILKANNQTVNGIRVANGHHAIVLAGIDEEGYGIFIDPSHGKINYAHGNGKYFKMKIETFVKNHMTSATGNYNVPYVTSIAAAGGYILVG